MDHDVVMICDGEKSIGIGGIMGGENSMITDDVKTMLFEAACFDGTNIRLSAKRIGRTIKLVLVNHMVVIDIERETGIDSLAIALCELIEAAVFVLPRIHVVVSRTGPAAL